VPLPRLAALVFGSGLCALVYQVVWLRELRLVFGASTPASAAVLAIFMGGLGLGGWLLGRRAQASPSPLWLYGNLEAGVALSAAVTPFTIGWVAAVYHGLGGSAALGGVGGALVRILLATLVLGVPTFLMGGTLPAIVRAATPDDDRARRSLGLLYGMNTVGAVMGVTLTTFLLLEMFGQRRSLWLAAALNLAVAVVARRWAVRARRLAAPPIALAEAGAPTVAAEEPNPEEVSLADTETHDGADRTWDTGSTPDSPDPAPARATPPLVAPPLPADRSPLDEPSRAGVMEPAAGTPLALVLALSAAVGFVFFLMEMAWYRMLSPLLGGSTYTFGVILLGALAGIGAGGLIYGAGRDSRRPTLAAFAGTCALEALFLVIPLALGVRIAVLTQALRGLEVLGFHGLVVGWLGIVGLVVVPVALVAGYQFPLLVALLGSGGREVSRHTGLAYAANTFGAIAGSLAGGFGLLALLSAPGVWRLATLLLVVMALLALAGSWRGRRPRVADERPGRGRLVATAATALVAAALCLVPGPGAIWRHSQIGAGRGPRELSGPYDIKRIVGERENVLHWEADGRESSVGILYASGLTFLVNGKADGNARLDGPTQVMSGLVAAALHPQPRNGLVIGLGTGSTAGWLADMPGMERVDVVELEPVIARFAAECAPVNRGAMTNPRVRLAIGDGREALLTSRQRWDVIVSEPSNPYRAGIASLFTREFYQAVAERLAEGGIFAQWLQAYEVDAEVMATVYATLGDVFPHVETWAVHRTDLLLVASTSPIRHDPERIRRLVGSEPLRSALPAVWGVEGIEGFYSGFMAGPGLTRRVQAADPPRNLDDLPIIEFGFARGLGRAAMIDELQQSVEPEEALPAGVELDWARVEEARHSRGLFFGRVPPGDGGDPNLSARDAARRAAIDGRPGDAARRWQEQPLPPEQLADRLLVAEGLAELGDERAAELVAGLRDRPVEAAAITARLHLRSGRRAEAATAVVTALGGLRRDPWPWPDLVDRTVQLALELSDDPVLAPRMEEALSQPFAVYIAERQRRHTRVQAAIAAGGSSCAEAFEAFEPHPVWSEPMLRLRRDCYRRTGHRLADRASADLDSFLGTRQPPLVDLLAPVKEVVPVKRPRDKS
jgi:spermidine synthase